MSTTDDISADSASLRGRTALVTGAGRGIGRHIASAFARAGANTVCVSRTKNELDILADEIHSLYGTPSIGVDADVSRPADVDRIIQKAEQAFGNVDVLVNNAGIARFDSLQVPTFDFDLWSRIIDVNLRAPVNLIRQVLPSMLDRGRGTIISIGSRAAVANMPFTSAYSTPKTALLRFQQCLECEIQGSGIGNFYIQPGNVATGLMRSEGIVDATAVEALPQLGKMMQRTEEISTTSPDVVAGACVRLAADPEAKQLSGLYMDAERGLDHMFDDIKRGTGSFIRARRLYELKIDQL